MLKSVPEGRRKGIVSSGEREDSMRIHVNHERRSAFLRVLRRFGRPLVVAIALAGTLALGLGFMGGQGQN